MQRPSTRRRFLRSTALAGITVSAGCVTSGQTESDSPASTDDAATDSPTPESGETTPEDLESWLADANGYSGDHATYGTDQRPNITVGLPVDDEFAFDPVAVEVPPMTRVRWEWSGHGGQHNVVALDGTFDSGRTNAQSGTCYEYIFDETGTYYFVSEPHRESGMKGAVVVREPPKTGNEAVDEWMPGANNYDGTVTDRTGTDAVSATVGAESDAGHFAFAPSVLRISTGATVTWEWTGEAPHNVSFEDIDVKSGDPVVEDGHTFAHTFDEAGTFLYACLPHRALGMRGAIIVE